MDRARRVAGQLLKDDRSNKHPEMPVRIARPVLERACQLDEVGEHGIARRDLGDGLSKRKRGPRPDATESSYRKFFKAGASAWPPASTGSNRSPCCSTLSSASRIPKRRGVTSSVSSSQRSGVDTGAPGFGRTE
jgi:hypothetical protein